MIIFLQNSLDSYYQDIYNVSVRQRDLTNNNESERQMNNEIQNTANLRVEKINAEAIKELLIAANDMKRSAERLLKEHKEILEQIEAIKTTSDIHHAVNNACSSLEVVASTLARTQERAKAASHTHAQINVLCLVLGDNFYGMPLIERAKEAIEIYS